MASMSSKTIVVDLQNHEKSRFRLDPMTLVLFFLVLAGALGCASYGQTLRLQVTETRKTVATLDEEIKQVKASLPIIEERKKRAAKLREQISLIQNLSKDPLHYASLLREVAQLMPSNLYFSNLSVEPGSRSISVSGSVVETPGHLPLATLSDLIRNINRSSSFRDAAVSNVGRDSKDGRSAWSFQLQFNYK